MDFLNDEIGDYLSDRLKGEENWKALSLDLIGQLEESSYFFHQIISSMPYSMMLISASGNVVAASKVMASKFLEIPREELIGKSFSQLSFPIFHNCSQDLFIKKILSEALLEGLDYESFLREALDKEENNVYVEMSVKIMRSEKQEILGLLLTFSEQMVRLNLVPSQQEKEQILKKMGSLSAGVIHEVRNPMQSISGIIQLIQMQHPQDEALQEKLAIVISEIGRINILLSEFLSFSGKEKMEVCYCHVNDICQEVLGLLQGNCHINGIELKQKLSDTVPKMVMDHNRIKQVIVNFVVNAIDAIKELRNSSDFCDEKYPDYQGEIVVATGYDYALNECYISVEDNGVGMSQSLINKITKPFFTTKKYGTGMGIAISNNIIMEYGGSLRVQSEPGQGSKFNVVLPELAGLMRLVTNNERKPISKKNHGKASKSTNNYLGVSANYVDIIKDGFNCIEKLG